jgi:PAS domain S-box-containing protein
MVEPAGVERVLAPEDNLVSRTDPRGHLTFVNDAFLAVSGYRDIELLGRPHHVIRHPDMPRAVLRFMEETLKVREEAFAYVMNLTADGAHYWALAHVTPSLDRRGAVTGYYWIHRAPSPAALRQIVPLYARFLEMERNHQGTRAAIDASSAALKETLRDRGQTYDQFVRQLIAEGRAA